MGTNLLTWIAKKQTTVSHSSSEVEYRALATTTAELRWFCYIFHELGFPIRTSPCIAKPVFHARTCHIDSAFTNP